MTIANPINAAARLMEEGCEQLYADLDPLRRLFPAWSFGFRIAILLGPGGGSLHSYRATKGDREVNARTVDGLRRALRDEIRRNGL